MPHTTFIAIDRTATPEENAAAKQRGCVGPAYIVLPYNRDQSEEAQYRRAARQRRLASLRHEIKSDPQIAEAYALEQEQAHVARRLAKQPQPSAHRKSHVRHCQQQPDFSSMTYAGILDHVRRNWIGNESSQYIGSRYASGSGGAGSGMTARQRLREARTRDIERKATEGDYAQRRFAPEFIKSVVAAREAQGLTRAELAHKIDVRESIITDFERGEMTYDGQLVNVLHNGLKLSGVAK